MSTVHRAVDVPGKTSLGEALVAWRKRTPGIPSLAQDELRQRGLCLCAGHTGSCGSMGSRRISLLERCFAMGQACNAEAKICRRLSGLWRRFLQGSRRLSCGSPRRSTGNRWPRGYRGFVGRMSTGPCAVWGDWPGGRCTEVSIANYHSRPLDRFATPAALEFTPSTHGILTTLLWSKRTRDTRESWKLGQVSSSVCGRQAIRA